jgi:hypothetical protein
MVNFMGFILVLIMVAMCGASYYLGYKSGERNAEHPGHS